MQLARALLQIIASRNLAKALFCMELALLLMAFFGPGPSTREPELPNVARTVQGWRRNRKL